MAKQTHVTPRSLQVLRACGYHCQVVERIIPGMFIKKDLFGLIDVMAVKADEPGVLGIQVTTRSNVSSHFHKALDLPALKVWLAAGNRLVIHAWGRVKERLKDGSWSKVGRWKLVERPVTLEILDAMAKASMAQEALESSGAPQGAPVAPPA